MVVAGEACGGVGFPISERPSKSTAIAADPMSLWKHYYLAHSVEDALQALAAGAGMGRVIAGGTDLLLDLQQGRQANLDTLVDVNQIPEMTSVALDGDWLSIGAAAPLSRLVSNELIQYHAEALIEACGLIGGPQVRNTATLGGNVAHALPAGDGSIALLALGAKAEVASLEGRSERPLAELYIGPGKSALQVRGQIVVRFLVPVRRPGQASAFKRVMRPQGVALPVLNMGVWLERGRQGETEVIGDIRIAIGPAGPVPYRANATEATLRGQVFKEDVLEEAKAILRNEARFRTSPQRATAEYRRHLAGVLLEQTLEVAWERAGVE